MDEDVECASGGRLYRECSCYMAYLHIEKEE